MKKNNILPFIKKWLLVVAMSLGVVGYFIVDAYVENPTSRHAVVYWVTSLLPYLLFMMLFLEFSKINPRDLFPKKWLIYSFIYQFGGGLAMIAVLLWAGLPAWTNGLWEGALVCLLCPTATAVAVMSAKLGGKAASATTYAVLSSLFAAFLIPALFPIVAQNSTDLTFWVLFRKIFAKVFPVIIVPLLLSFFMREFAPSAHRWVARFAKDKSFYLWAFCVMINTAQVLRIIFMGLLDGKTTLLYCLFASLLCFVNFWTGKKFGDTCDDRLSAGQSLGQKNTILAIWVAMSFLHPTSGIVMGAYMIWQNLFNSLQLSYPKLR